MRTLSTLLLVSLLSTGVIVGAERGLADYVDKDLADLTPAERQKFSEELHKIVKPSDTKNPDIPDTFKPEVLKPFASGKARWIYVEAYCGEDVPDLSAVRVHLFDEAWNKIHSESYPTGKTSYMGEIRVEKNVELQLDLLIIQLDYQGEGPRHNLPVEQLKQTQYYAFTGDRMALIRLENKNKKLIVNNYTSTNPEKGGVVPKHTKAEWIETLTSGSTVEQLAALVWLSGAHLKSTVQRIGLNEQSVENSVLYEEVFNSELTKTAVQNLNKHESEWIKAYAELIERSRNKNH